MPETPQIVLDADYAGTFIEWDDGSLTIDDLTDDPPDEVFVLGPHRFNCLPTLYYRYLDGRYRPGHVEPPFGVPRVRTHGGSTTWILPPPPPA